MPDNNREDCPCLNLQCSRYGDCDSCEKYQLSRGNAPYCKRTNIRVPDELKDETQ